MKKILEKDTEYQKMVDEYKKEKPALTQEEIARMDGNLEQMGEVGEEFGETGEEEEMEENEEFEEMELEDDAI